MEIEGLGSVGICNDVDRFASDSNTDRLIGDCLGSKEYTNQVFSYFYDCRHWPIRIIHNPNKEKLQLSQTTGYTGRYRYALISKEILPKELENHLRKLVKEHLGEDVGGFISIASEMGVGGVTYSTFDLFEHFKPVDEEPGSSDSPMISNPKPISIPTIPKPISIQRPQLERISPSRSSPFQYDEQGDLKVSEYLGSKEFTNISFPYLYENQQYEIRILNNPQKELLWREGMPSAVKWTSIITANQALPVRLEWHLKDVALKANKDTIIDLKNTRTHLPQFYASLQPVQSSPEINNSLFDKEIREIFASKQYINRVFHYQLEGTDKVISVRIIHNPEKKTLSWKRSFKDGFRKSKEFTLSWGREYGVFFNEKAPEALVDHLSQLVPTSSWDLWNLSKLWDWMFNSTIYNGTLATFNEFEHFGTSTRTTTYTTTSWFDFTSDMPTQ